MNDKDKSKFNKSPAEELQQAIKDDGLEGIDIFGNKDKPKCSECGKKLAKNQYTGNCWCQNINCKMFKRGMM